MSNRYLLPGFRSPKPRRFGLRTVADTPEVEGRWAYDGVTWEQVCATGAGVGAVPCDTSPMTGYETGELAANVAGTTAAGADPTDEVEGPGFDAFFAYAMIECGMLGMPDAQERARVALELAEDDIIASRLLAEVRVHQPASLDTTIGAKAALGAALDGWAHGGDPVVLMTHNVAQAIDLNIEDGHLELETGERVYVFRDRFDELSQVSDSGAGHIILLGGVVLIEGEVDEHLVPVTNMDEETATFNNDQVALAMKPMLVGFDCAADWYRVQGLSVPAA